MVFIKISMSVLISETLQWMLIGDCRRTVSDYLFDLNIRDQVGFTVSELS